MFTSCTCFLFRFLGIDSIIGLILLLCVLLSRIYGCLLCNRENTRTTRLGPRLFGVLVVVVEPSTGRYGAIPHVLISFAVSANGKEEEGEQCEKH